MTTEDVHPYPVTAPSFSINGGMLEVEEIVTMTPEENVLRTLLPKRAEVGLRIPILVRKPQHVSQNFTKYIPTCLIQILPPTN
jgi:hypothetical protein